MRPREGLRGGRDGQGKVAQASHLIYTLSQVSEQMQRRRLGHEPTADPALAKVGKHLDDLERALGQAGQQHAAADVQRETGLAGGHLEDVANATAALPQGEPASAPAAGERGSRAPVAAADSAPAVAGTTDLAAARAALARARVALNDLSGGNRGVVAGGPPVAIARLPVLTPKARPATRSGPPW